MLKAGSSFTAQCQSASGRNLSLAAEVTINGIPVTEKDGYRLEFTNRDSSAVAVCEAVQQGNNSIDLNETASAPFTVLGEGRRPSLHATGWCKKHVCHTLPMLQVMLHVVFWCRLMFVHAPYNSNSSESEQLLIPTIKLMLF